VHADDAERLAARLVREGRTPAEAYRLERLVDAFLSRPTPPQPRDLYPAFPSLLARLAGAVAALDGDRVEEAFLELYCHLHGNDGRYTPSERAIVDRSGGYWAHAGGLSPILKAPDWIADGSVSADFGAGNGLQLLLVQLLAPHAKSVQIEVSGAMIAAGIGLQRWLGIPPERVEWRHADVMDESPADFDLILLYRPVRPEGPGRAFYERFGAALSRERRPVAILSVADCLGPFLPADVVRVYFDGQLTCYRRGRDACRRGGGRQRRRRRRTATQARRCPRPARHDGRTVAATAARSRRRGRAGRARIAS
jgi:hypothetical protein